MPCRNDWDPPTKAQAENRRAAKLLIALNNIHGLTSSTQLLVDSTNPVLDTDYVKVLCERVGALSDSDRETVLYGDAHDPRAAENYESSALTTELTARADRSKGYERQ